MHEASRSRQRRGRAVRRLALVASLALGLVAGGGVAWAYWTTQARWTASTLTSGRMDLVVSQGGTTTAVGSGTPFTLTGLQPTLGYFPGTSVATSLRVTNAATSTAPLRMTGGTVTVSATSPTVFTGTLVWGGTSNGTTCSGGSTAVPTTVLQPGAGLDVCIQVALTSSTNASQSAPGTVTVTFTSSQVQR